MKGKGEEINNFLEETAKWISEISPHEEKLVSQQFKEFSESIFICYFLYDCIIKGIKTHQKSIESRLKDIVKRMSPSEAERVKTDFKNLIENTELISILAYEFFINYLHNMLYIVYKQNLKYLKDLEKIEYKGHEIVDRLNQGGMSADFIVDDLINLKIFGSKEGGNLKTNADFWIKLIKGVGIEIDSKMESFWVAFHDRRNAASHIEARPRWNELKTNIKHNLIDLPLWMLGLLLLAYKIDEKFCSRFDIEKIGTHININGEPIYEMEVFNFKHCG